MSSDFEGKKSAAGMGVRKWTMLYFFKKLGNKNARHNELED